MLTLVFFQLVPLLDFAQPEIGPIVDRVFQSHEDFMIMAKSD
jgi:hypothetical protein